MAKRSPSKIRLTAQYRGGYKDRAGKFYTEAEGKSLLDQGKATRSQWKGKKTPKETFEGQQYRGGRQKGRGNLTKTDTGVINQHGVEFTTAERKALDNAVNKANRYREKMLDQEGSLDRVVGGKPTGQKVNQLQLMGKESDFIIARQSKSLQRFKSKEDFEQYMDKLGRINSGEYLDDMTRAYKRNHMKALENVFGDEGKDVIMKIRMMKPEQYREMIQKDEMLEVSYVYDPSARTGKLNQIRQSLGMKPKEEDLFSPE